MKKFGLMLCAALMMFCAQVFAQDPAANVVNCGPKLGTNNLVGINVNPPGVWQSYWCMHTDGEWHLFIDALPAATAVKVAKDYSTIALSSGVNYADGVRTLRNVYPELKVSSEDTSLKPIWIANKADILASRPAKVVPPKVYIWKVAINGVAATRQGFAFDPVTLTLGAKFSGVKVGTQCWPNLGGVSKQENGVEVFYLPYGAREDTANKLKVSVCTKEEVPK